MTLNATRYTVFATAYGVALVSGIDTIVGFFCKRALQKRQYSAQETYNLIDHTNRSYRIHIIATPCPHDLPLALVIEGVYSLMPLHTHYCDRIHMTAIP